MRFQEYEGALVARLTAATELAHATEAELASSSADGQAAAEARDRTAPPKIQAYRQGQLEQSS